MGRALEGLGQSLWLDSLRRQMLVGGELGRRIRDDGVQGVRSNARVFERVLAGSADYDAALRELARHAIVDAPLIYESLLVEDVRRAADVLKPVFDASQGRDGHACLELPPSLAHDRRALVSEGRRLWYRLARSNVMLSVPASNEGIEAMRELVAGGISVNVNLVSGLACFGRVAEAYLCGLEALLISGIDLSRVAGLATVCLAPLDSLADGLIEERAPALPIHEQAELRRCQGRLAIATARRICDLQREMLAGARFARLRAAQPLRVAFDHTFHPDPRRHELQYVHELIGPNTVAVLTPHLLDALGAPDSAPTSGDQTGTAAWLDHAERFGLAPDGLADRVLEENLARQRREHEHLLGTLALRFEGALEALPEKTKLRLPEPLAAAVGARFARWREGEQARRLWASDGTLWTGNGEGRHMKWLVEPRRALANIQTLHDWAHQVRAQRFTTVALLGMGGAPSALRALAALPAPSDAPRLTVIDSCALARAAAAGAQDSLFIVAAQPHTRFLQATLFAEVSARLGEDARHHFVAIVEPNTPDEEEARRTCDRLFVSPPGIPDSFAALSPFVLVPAAAAQLDVTALLEGAERMALASAACVPPEQNPSLALGLALGCALAHGCRHLRVVTSPPLAAFGPWLERLALLTLGDRLLPDRNDNAEPGGHPAFLAYLRLDGAAQAAQDGVIDDLVQAGQPVVQLDVADVYEMGQEFFRWQLALTTAAADLHINPFQDET
jgi:transaldolase/glucose-6-phosphate isomerase